MPRFILIDQSITGIGGHYYEYAVHVLSAAEEAGYTPILVTNKQFSQQTGLRWTVIPAFTYTYWFIYHTPQWLNNLQQFEEALRNLKAMVSVWLTFAPSAAPARVLTRLIFAPLRMLKAGIRRALRSKRSAGEADSPAAAPSAAASPAATPSLRRRLSPRRLAQSIISRLRSRQFGKDSVQLCAVLSPTAEDIMFIPTISVLELDGLFKVLGQHAEMRQPHWHLLFRQDLFPGRVLQEIKLNERAAALKDLLATAQTPPFREKIAFYTDTEELTMQYNSLYPDLFHTMPIPHTHQNTPRPRQRTKTVLYMGDARQEKGYYLLPHIIQDVWHDYVKNGLLSFVIQSNYNIPDGEPRCIVARAQLQHFPADAVKLLLSPLSSDAYNALLLSGDINLLHYDANQYFARSSGILVESLAAGIPVITSAGSWMARQFVREIYRYHLQVKQRYSCHAVDVESDDTGGRKYPWQAQDNYLLLEYQSRRCAPYALRRFSLTMYDAHGYPLAGTPWHIEELSDIASYSMLLKVAAGTAAIRITPPPEMSADDFTLQCLAFAGETVPTSAVGLIYHDVDEISALLMELTDCYEHYVASARAFAPALLRRHNANNLIKHIQSSSTGRPAERTVIV